MLKIELSFLVATSEDQWRARWRDADSTERAMMISDVIAAYMDDHQGVTIESMELK